MTAFEPNLCYFAAMSSQMESLVRLAEDPRFPIGKFARPEIVTVDERIYAIATLAELPSQLRNAVDDLDRDQLETPYRIGGWTVRQLVHHIADSHMNAVMRVRMALTEDWPTIFEYDEKVWATMHDYRGPVEWSLELIESLHARWVMLLQSLDDNQWQRGFMHPKAGRMTVEFSTMLYAWHSRHHVAHITHLRAREDW
jgi:DinB superfamily